MSDKPVLTLQDLYEKTKAQIENNPHSAGCKVCIPNNKGGIGGTSVTYANNAGCGIDWDVSKFFIWPENKMVEAGREPIKDWRQKANEWALKQMPKGWDIEKATAEEIHSFLCLDANVHKRLLFYLSKNDITMSDKQYNPVECEHKHENGFSAWSFQSEEQSNLGGANKVSVHVCVLCGEINIGGYRPSKDEKHVNSFHETFNIYHPDAIDAIIKQANFYNEKEIWGRIQPSESPQGHVWVKASDRLPDGPGKITWRWLNKEAAYSGFNGTAFVYDTGGAQVDMLYAIEIEWLDEATPTVQPNKEDAAGSNIIDRLKSIGIDDIDAPVFTHSTEFTKHFDYIKEKFIQILGAAGSGKEEAVACTFLEWAYANRWFNKEGDLWCYTFEMGTAISDKAYRKNYMKTTNQLYDIYKQNK